MVGKSISTLRYMDAAVRRNEGKLCFIKRKSKDLVSNCRVFREKNISFFENRERSNKNLWTFFRNAPSFFFFLPLFGKKRPSLRPPCHSLFPHPHSLTRERTRPCASRTQRVRNSCLHLHPQFADAVCVAREEKVLFLPSPVKETRVKSSPTSRCFRAAYSRMVKR